MCLTTVAFYNVENLFDPLNAAHTLDKDFTPKGKKKWDKRETIKKRDIDREIKRSMKGN